MRILVLVIGLCLTNLAEAQVLADLVLHAGTVDRVETPVTVRLEGIAGPVILYDVTGGIDRAVPSDFDGRALRFVATGTTPAGTTRTYELRAGTVQADSRASIADNGESLILLAGERPVLAYRHAVQPVPKESTPLNARSGFIHPLWSPSGEVLTRIQPPDHWHHYGIWNPWTHTRFQGKQVDFWNLFSGQGLVRHARILEQSAGQARAGFRALLDHVVTDSLTGQTTALHEQWAVGVWNAPVPVVDFASTLSPAGPDPLTIEAYRYQGFGFRGRPDWGDETSDILTSEGMDKSTGNTTRARWIRVQGVSGAPEGISGVLLMTHPGNHNYPEHLRIWPTGMNGGVENIFINFNPAQDVDWELGAGTSHTLRYRIVPFDGDMDAGRAERHWRDFADPPRVTVERNGLAGARILVYTKNGEGYVHENIPYSVEAIERLGAANGFEVVASDDPAMFHPDTLAAYAAIVFSNTNNEIFETREQRAALQQFVRGGHGIVGIHSASGSERDWPWFSRLLGGNFQRHAPLQDFTVDVIDPTHPSTAFLPARWDIDQDECYFLKELSPNLRVLLAADLDTVQDAAAADFPGDRFGDTFPLVWYQEFDGGRQWYTTLGHRPEHYADPVFMRHILGGLRWAVGASPP